MVASEESLVRQTAPRFLSGGAPPAERPDTPAALNARLGLMAQQVEQELADALAPFPVTGTRLTFGAPGEPLQLSAQVGRDYALSADERLILARQLERVLQLPVTLALTTAPLLPPLTVERDGRLDDLARQNLDFVRELPGGAEGFRFVVTAQRKNRKEAEAVRQYLSQALAIPETLLSVSLLSGARNVQDGVTLRILRNQRRTL